VFLWKSVKSIRYGRENGVDTLKLHHDTLLNTFKKTMRPRCMANTNVKNKLIVFKVMWNEWVLINSKAAGHLFHLQILPFSHHTVFYTWLQLQQLLTSPLLLRNQWHVQWPDNKPSRWHNYTVYTYSVIFPCNVVDKPLLLLPIIRRLVCSVSYCYKNPSTVPVSQKVKYWITLSCGYDHVISFEGTWFAPM